MSINFFAYLHFQEGMTFVFQDIFQKKVTENGVTESMLKQDRSLTIGFESEFYRHKHFKYDVSTSGVRISIMLNPWSLR